MMITLQPIETIEIGGRALRVGMLAPDRLKACGAIGQGLRAGVFEGWEVPQAVATIMACLVAEHHPTIRPSDLVRDLTYFHFVQTANELARQLLLSLPAQRMGKA